MKFLSTYLLYFLSSVFFIFAVSESKGQFNSYGVQFGANIMEANKTNAYGTNYNTGFDIGLFAEYSFTEKIGIRSGLFYSTLQKNFTIINETQIDSNLIQGIYGNGSNENLPEMPIEDSIYSLIVNNADLSITETTKGTTNMGYFQIPLFVTLKSDKLELFAGGYFSYLMSAHTVEVMTQDIPALDVIKAIDDSKEAKFVIKLLYPGYYSPDVDETTRKGHFNEIDYGLAGGLSYHTSDNFIFSMKLSYSLAEYYPDPPDGFETISKNHVFMNFSLGFDIGKTSIAEVVKF